MQTVKWNDEWLFWDARTPENKKKVWLPHDAMLQEQRLANIQNGVATGFFPGGKYYYSKPLFGKPEYENQTVMLEFEGVYMNSTVLCNGEKVGGRIYGYSDFYADLTGKLRIGEENEILVIADNTHTPNSRWYSGSGIYRDVYLVTGSKKHIMPNGISVRTVSIDPAVLQITVETSDHSGKADAGETERKTATREAGIAGAKESIRVEIYDGGRMVATGEGRPCSITVPNAKLWSAEEPNIYEVKVYLLEDGVTVDTASVRTGIRSLSWNAASGLLVNGKRTVLRGGCVHHDHGALGARELYAAELRRVRKMKELGFNAIRYAHNPASKVFLDVCDEVGMYVMDESFDQWEQKQSPYDYGVCFAVEWERDLESMVWKARNHPSVIMYSIGNEISDIGVEKGQEWNRKLAEKCRELDNTRPVVNCINPVVAMMGSISKSETSLEDEVNSYEEKPDAAASGSLLANMIMTMVPVISNLMGKPKKVEKKLKPVMDALDIVGYNYAERCYTPHHEWNPKRVMVGSETYVVQNIRNWEFMKSAPYVIGDFIWTAWDYLGESGIGQPIYGTSRGGFNRPYPAISGGCGLFDLTGMPETSAYYTAIAWGQYRKPYIGVRPVNHSGEKHFFGQWRFTDTVHSWSWSGMEGRNAEIEVYSPGKEVELFQDGRSLGKKQTELYLARFETHYTSGRLEAVAYDAQGAEIGRDELISASGNSVLRALPEKSIMKADGEDLIYIPICITDEHGIVWMLSDRKITVSVEGAAELAGICSAATSTQERFDGDSYTTFHGRALAILRSNGAEGEIRVTVSAEGLSACGIQMDAIG